VILFVALHYKDFKICYVSSLAGLLPFKKWVARSGDPRSLSPQQRIWLELHLFVAFSLVFSLECVLLSWYRLLV
jgi:hypothetical protein